ncbi:MAG: peptide chain release factor 2 [Mariniblastus sp.]|nr:peptide chain release factor 2 [Mariniblastus sp.]
MKWTPNSSNAQNRFASALPNYGTVFDYDTKRNEVSAIENQMAAPGFWDNQEKAQMVVGSLKSVKSIVGPMTNLLSAGEDLDALLEMANDEPEIEDEIRGEVTRLESQLSNLELKSLLNGPHDQCGAIMTIYARDGGTDANDWAAMMLRMYSQWANQNDYEVVLIDRSDNDEAGINNATVAIRGPMAYGYLKGEQGMHRLVRISPFNSEGKRQTSFAAVDVAPEVPDSEEIEIDEKEVKTDTYRASGAGGQHVNKTDSAVRLTHKPTGIAVQCQSERSQHKNRAQAWKMLRAQIARLEDEKREAEEAAKYKDKARVGFGSQIRNYFLHPDQRVKDARTGYSMGDFNKVLDGQIQGFLDAFLNWRVKSEGK